MIDKLNSFLLLFFIISISAIFAEKKHNTSQVNSSHENDHHSSQVDGELIMHHIQDGTTFEIFNPISPTHPFELKLSLLWKDLFPITENLFGDELFLNKQAIMILLASILLVLAFASVTSAYRKPR